MDVYIEDKKKIKYVGEETLQVKERKITWNGGRRWRRRRRNKKNSEMTRRYAEIRENMDVEEEIEKEEDCILPETRK